MIKVITWNWSEGLWAPQSTAGMQPEYLTLCSSQGGFGGKNPMVRLQTAFWVIRWKAFLFSFLWVWADVIEGPKMNYFIPANTRANTLHTHKRNTTPSCQQTNTYFCVPGRSQQVAASRNAKGICFFLFFVMFFFYKYVSCAPRIIGNPLTYNGYKRHYPSPSKPADFSCPKSKPIFLIYLTS